MNHYLHLVLLSVVVGLYDDNDFIFPEFFIFPDFSLTTLEYTDFFQVSGHPASSVETVRAKLRIL